MPVTERPILLTGATGFVGMTVLARLLADGREVHCLIRAANDEEADARLRAVLARSGLRLRDGAEADERLRLLRRMYEPYVNGLACHLLIPLPPWLHAAEHADNWQTSAFERGPRAAQAASAAAPAEGEHF